MPMLWQAGFDDIALMQELMYRSAQAIFPRFYSPEQAASAALYLTVPDRDLIADGTSYLVSKRGEVVGCGAWSTRKKLFTGSIDQEDLSEMRLDPEVDPAKIRAFFVAPEYARQGIARLIYDKCEEAAREAKFKSFELMATLPGVAFYENVGYSRQEETNILLPDGVLLPCIRMWKKI